MDITRGLGKVSSRSSFINLENIFALNDTNEAAVSNVDCVAIGLASSEFSFQKRLPGWDKESYGYHGDDGAIFHGRGYRLAEYGPRFGPGDTVGCGINYTTRTIFFTLNGLFLGDAFYSVEGSLFPTVGIDAAVDISLNFGRAPFKFDLGQYIIN